MKTAIVGLGRMGAVHYDAMRSSGFEVALGFDQQQDAAKHFVDARPLACLSLELLEAALVESSVEGVVVATTTPSRFDLISRLARIENLKWIVAEKPIVSSLDQLASLIKLEKLGNVRLAVNHQMMFLPQYESIRGHFTDGALGPFQSMNVSGANFGLANNVSHYFEAFRFLTGTEVCSVRGFLEPRLQASHRGPEFADHAGFVLAKNARGATLFVDFQSGAGHGIVVVYNFAFGKIVVDELLGRVRVSKRKEHDHSESTGKYGLEAIVEELTFQAGDLESPVARLLSAVSSGATEFPGISVASHAVRCVVATIVSAERNSEPQDTDFGSLSPYLERVFSWS